jgi:hypothetical protein
MKIKWCSAQINPRRNKFYLCAVEYFLLSGHNNCHKETIGRTYEVLFYSEKEGWVSKHPLMQLNKQHIRKVICWAAYNEAPEIAFNQQKECAHAE